MTQINSYHFCVLYAGKAIIAQNLVKQILIGFGEKKKLRYQVGNVVNTASPDDILIFDNELQTLEQINQYINDKIVPMPWEVKIPGDLAIIKLKNDSEMLQEDWQILAHYSYHCQQQSLESGKFDIQSHSIFEREYDANGVTQLMESNVHGQSQYIVVIQNFNSPNLI